PSEQVALKEGDREDLQAVISARLELLATAEAALSLPAPPRNRDLTAQMARDLAELRTLWDAAQETLKSDQEEGRLAVARAIRFGEGIGRAWAEERARIYNEPPPPPTADPARPF
ncbi:MAG: hypothetical protein MH204_02560, partial [Fimbriimonadaceae bacterium]|nr:hypothetical protein [Fimbriimonadaceae bacterium]